MKKLRTNKKEEGITLVALIITIIVLVILAAVSVATVYNSKIVNYAVNGSIDYTQAAVNENEILKGSVDIIESGIGKIQEIIGDSGSNTPVTPPTPPVQGKPADELEIGAYVSYVPKAASKYDIPKERVSDQNDDGSYGITAPQEFHPHTSTDETKTNTDWRIWDKPDSTHIRLISTKASTDKIQFHGANGYNNIVGVLNEACSTVYSHSDYATAKSIDMDDIDAKRGTAQKQSGTSSPSTYEVSSSPSIYEAEKTGSVNRSWQGESSSALSWYTGRSSTRFIPVLTLYRYNLSEFPNTTKSPYYALLSQQDGSAGDANPSSYLTASRAQSIGFNGWHDYASFHMHVVGKDVVGACALYNSEIQTYLNIYQVRPLVTLDLTKCNVGATGSGTETSPYSITKK